MKILTSTTLVLAVGFALLGCATDQADRHVLKLDRTSDHAITNPHEWALQQFSDGPISGPDVSDYARGVLKWGLLQALADLDLDGKQELFLRQDGMGRVWEVLVFTPVKDGYRYIGHFPASYFVLDPDNRIILVYEACGGKYGHIKAYRHDGDRFIGTLLESMWSGDGYEENNKKRARLFPKDKVINWMKMTSSLQNDPRLAHLILKLRSNVNHPFAIVESGTPFLSTLANGIRVRRLEDVMRLLRQGGKRLNANAYQLSATSPEKVSDRTNGDIRQKESFPETYCPFSVNLCRSMTNSYREFGKKTKC